MSDNQNCDFAKAIGNGIVQHCTFVKGHIGKPHSYEAQPVVTAQRQAPTNAELLRLLERHHAVSIEEDQLHPADDKHYVGTALCEHTEAAIERAKGVQRG